MLARHLAMSADVPGGHLGPQGWGWHRRLVDRDRGAAQPPAVHRADPTTKNDQAQTSTAPRCRRPGLTVWQVCKTLVPVAQAGGSACFPECQLLLPAGRGAPASAPKDEPPTDQVGRGPLRCEAGLMEAKGGSKPEGSSLMPPGDSGDEGVPGVQTRRSLMSPGSHGLLLDPGVLRPAGREGRGQDRCSPRPCPSAGRQPGHRAFGAAKAGRAVWLPPPGWTQQCPHVCSPMLRSRA